MTFNSIHGRSSEVSRARILALSLVAAITLGSGALAQAGGGGGGAGGGASGAGGAAGGGGAGSGGRQAVRPGPGSAQPAPDPGAAIVGAALWPGLILKRRAVALIRNISCSNNLPRRLK